MKLKNPWNHLRWRGKYSDQDTQHWTSDLKRALDYDPLSARQHDDGTCLFLVGQGRNVARVYRGWGAVVVILAGGGRGGGRLQTVILILVGGFPPGLFENLLCLIFVNLLRIIPNNI